MFTVRLDSKTALPALAGLILLAGCGGEEASPDAVVARIGDRVVTIRDFEEFSTLVGPEYLPASDDLEGKKEFLDVIINKELMAIKADELGFDKDPTLMAGKEHFEKGALIASYYQRNARDKAEAMVNDEVAREYYDKLGTEVDIRQIVVNSRDLADKLYERIQAGEDMAALARKYSKSKRASRGGLWPNLKYTTTKVEFEDHVFDLKVGEVSKPFLTQYGWNIVKMLKKRKEDPGTWEEKKDYARRLARGRIEARLANELRDDLLAKANFYVDPEVRQLVYNAFPPDIPFDQAPRRGTEVFPILKLSDENLKKILCTFDDEVWTVEHFSDLYDQTAFHKRPRREHNVRGIDHYIISMIIDRLIVEDAKRQALDRDPTVVKAVQNRHEEAMVSIMHNQLIESEVQVLPDEMKEYYEEHKDAYVTPEYRNFQIVLVADEGVARDVYEEAAGGAGFLDLVFAYSQDDATRENNGETGWISRGQNPALEDAGFALAEVGEISEPFEIPSRGWAVIRLIDIQDAKELDYAEAEPYVRRDLKTIKSDEVLEKYLSRWREEIAVEINDKNLKRARLARPAGD